MRICSPKFCTFGIKFSDKKKFFRQAEIWGWAQLSRLPTPLFVTFWCHNCTVCAVVVDPPGGQFLYNVTFCDGNLIVLLISAVMCILLCGRPKRSQYGSCPSVCLSVCLSVPYKLITGNQKSPKNHFFLRNPQGRCKHTQEVKGHG